MLNRILADFPVFGIFRAKTLMISRKKHDIFRCGAMFLRNCLIRVENHDIQLDMFIRRTKISSSSSGEAHYTFRLVVSKRTGKKVQQKTLLNLGANFSLPKELWPQLCSRVKLHRQSRWLGEGPWKGPLFIRTLASLADAYQKILDGEYRHV
jgi:hypothetical protein